MATSIAVAAGMMGLLGVCCALFLGIAARVLRVTKDERVVAIEQIFGGTNCGACGFASCAAAAEAVVTGLAEVTICELGGRDTAKQVAAVMGTLLNANAPAVESISPPASVGDSSIPPSDPLMDRVSEGPSKKTRVRELPPPVPLAANEFPVIDVEQCIGCGLCVRACTYGAIVGEPKTVPVISLDQCTKCGACIPSCRKNFISIGRTEKGDA